MSQSYDVVIVSAFGRGHWLASECAEKSMKVALVDVASSLGRWAPEDWEGPFGFFQDGVLTASQTERLFADDYHDTVDEGLVVWLKDGPYDLKGPMSSFWQKRLNVTPEVQDYISNFQQLKSEDREALLKKISELNFDDSWFINLTHQVASSVINENSVALSKGAPISAFSPLHIRRATRRGYEKSLKWCEDKGVDVFRDASLGDVQITNDKIDALEIRGEDAKILFANNYVWGITSEETQYLSEAASKRIYAIGNIESEWNWMRFRMQVNFTPAVEIMPLKFIIVEDIYLPWVHENLCLVEKTVQQGSLDLWVRVPTQQRFHKTYLEGLQQKLKNILNSRIPNAKASGVDLPQDYHYDYPQQGPPRFPVFESQSLNRLKPNKIKNIYFDGPECCENLDWVSQIMHQSQILPKLEKPKGAEVDTTL